MKLLSLEFANLFRTILSFVVIRINMFNQFERFDNSVDYEMSCFVFIKGKVIYYPINTKDKRS